MKTALSVLLLICFFSGCGRVKRDRILASNSGTYVTGDGLATLEVQTPAPTTVRYTVSFKNGGIVGPISCEVVPGRWAFYVPDSSEVWLAGGDSLVMLIEHKGIQIVSSDSRVVPALYRRVPVELKRFVKEPNQHLRATEQGKSRGE